MKRNTLIEHKEIVVVCEESGHVSMSYNVLLTKPKANAGVKLVVLVMIVKSTLTCTDYGKTSHSMETYHNKKKNVLVVPIAKSTKHVIGTKTQLVKSRKILVHYPCIICYNIGHRCGKCPRKIKVQNMFRIKPISFNATTTFKPPKSDNVLVNVIVVITTHNQ